MLALNSDYLHANVSPTPFVLIFFFVRPSTTLTCAAKHRYGMPRLKMVEVSHSCMNCAQPMHGALCGVLFSERNPSIKITKNVLTKNGQALFNSSSALLCALCVDHLDGAKLKSPFEDASTVVKSNLGVTSGRTASVGITDRIADQLSSKRKAFSEPELVEVVSLLTQPSPEEKKSLESSVVSLLTQPSLEENKSLESSVVSLLTQPTLEEKKRSADLEQEDWSDVDFSPEELAALDCAIHKNDETKPNSVATTGAVAESRDTKVILMFDMIMEYPVEDATQLVGPEGMLGHKTHWQGMQEVVARRAFTMAQVIRGTINFLLQEKVRKRHRHRVVRVGNGMLQMVPAEWTVAQVEDARSGSGETFRILLRREGLVSNEVVDRVVDRSYRLQNGHLVQQRKPDADRLVRQSGEPRGGARPIVSGPPT